jgi:hypothetical protein
MSTEPRHSPIFLRPKTERTERSPVWFWVRQDNMVPVCESYRLFRRSGAHAPQGAAAHPVPAGHAGHLVSTCLWDDIWESLPEVVRTFILDNDPGIAYVVGHSGFRHLTEHGDVSDAAVRLQSIFDVSFGLGWMGLDAETVGARVMQAHTAVPLENGELDTQVALRGMRIGWEHGIELHEELKNWHPSPDDNGTADLAWKFLRDVKRLF